MTQDEEPIGKRRFGALSELEFAAEVARCREESLPELANILQQLKNDETLGMDERVVLRERCVILAERLFYLEMRVVTDLNKKTGIADAVLLFVCKPDDAEAVVGDLIESFAKVKERQGAIYAKFWFYWTLVFMFLSKGKRHLVKLGAATGVITAFVKFIR